MTADNVNDTGRTERLLLWAVIISLLLHVLVYSLWRVGQAQGWWQAVVMPRWMQSISKALLPAIPKNHPVDDVSPTQLTFVDVDPALATPTPPKKPMFQGAQNTVAANREIKVLSPLPNIDGHQEKFLKTTDDGKSQPTPKPVPAAPAQPQTAPAQPQSVPKQTYLPGDLAMVRPSDKAQEGKRDADVADQAQPQPIQEYHRPRTLAEAQARNGITGPQTHHIGGARNVTTDVSLDVQGTPLGDYLARMVDAVRSHWYQLLENQSADIPGQVVLHFRLLPDGRIANMSVVRNDVSDFLKMMCERAVLDPKFPKWPREMRLDLPNDYYDITFTFYYEP